MHMDSKCVPQKLLSKTNNNEIYTMLVSSFLRASIFKIIASLISVVCQSVMHNADGSAVKLPACESAVSTIRLGNRK